MSEPIPAAAGIIVGEGDDPEILLARRSEKLRFMGGHHVFPGGRIDEADGETPVERAPNRDEAVAIAAVAREVFEETGLLFAQGTLPGRDAMRAAREALLDGKPVFPQFLRESGLVVDAGAFTPAGLWVTPPMSPIRFHTRYYMVRHEGERYEELIEGEMMGLDWLKPHEARTRWRGGDLHLSPPVAYVLQHLARVPMDKVSGPLTRTSDKTPGVPSRMEMRCGIFIIPVVSSTIPPATHTNCVVVGEDELVVIDPGCDDPDETQHLIEQIEAMLDIGEHVSKIVLTHSHPDHVGAAEALRDKFGVPIWAHAATDAQLSFQVDRHIADNETIDIAGNPAWRLRAVHTPGHDPGHLAFIEESTRTLIGGDINANPGTIIVSREFGGDMGDYLASLDRLIADESYSVLIPSHGMPMGKPREKLAALKAHRLEREAKVQAAWDSGLRTIGALIPEVYSDTAEAAWPMAEHSLKAHLHHLGLEPDA